MKNGLKMFEPITLPITMSGLLRYVAVTGQQKHSRDSEAFPEKCLEKPLKEAPRNILEKFEKGYLTNHLTSTNGRVGEAAKRASIDSRTLFDKIKLSGIYKGDFRTNRRKR